FPLWKTWYVFKNGMNSGDRSFEGVEEMVTNTSDIVEDGYQPYWTGLDVNKPFRTFATTSRTATRGNTKWCLGPRPPDGWGYNHFSYPPPAWMRCAAASYDSVRCARSDGAPSQVIREDVARVRQRVLGGQRP